MITSVHNAKVQAVRKLQGQPKARHEEQAFVVEGVRLAEEVLQAGWVVRQLFFTDQLDERGKAIVEACSSLQAPIDPVSLTVMEAMSETETPQGLLLVVAMQTLALPPALDFLLILDRVRDPGNLGTVLRSAAAAGVQGVLLTPGCADAWSGKVLRAGMGAHFHLPIQAHPWPGIQNILKPSGLKVYLADAAEGTPYTQADFREPLGLIVGGEAAGAGAEAVSLADEKVHIPMPGGSESLNTGIAASILLFEVIRQRKTR